MVGDLKGEVDKYAKKGERKDTKIATLSRELAA